MTGFAFHANIRKKVHLDDPHATTLTGLTAASFTLKENCPGAYSANGCFRKRSEQIADVGKDPV